MVSTVMATATTVHEHTIEKNIVILSIDEKCEFLKRN